MSEDAGALPECRVKTLMTPDDTSPSRCPDLARVELELAGLSGKTLIWDAKRRLLLVAHAAISCMPLCSADSVVVHLCRSEQ